MAAATEGSLEEDVMRNNIVMKQFQPNQVNVSYDQDRIKFKNFSNLDLRSNESSVEFQSNHKLNPKNGDDLKSLKNIGSEISLIIKRKVSNTEVLNKDQTVESNTQILR